MPIVALALAFVLVVSAVVATGVLIVVTLRAPKLPPSDRLSAMDDRRARHGLEPRHNTVPPSDDRPTRLARLRRTHDDGSRIRLASRLLFARRSFDAITLDCILVRVDSELPAHVKPPEGLPFTLRLRCPDTSWFATRVEELLNEWADQGRELEFELTSENGKVRTTIASDGSSVHLELASAAGLGSDLNAA